MWVDSSASLASSIAVHLHVQVEGLSTMIASVEELVSKAERHCRTMQVAQHLKASFCCARVCININIYKVWFREGSALAGGGGVVASYELHLLRPNFLHAGAVPQGEVHDLPPHGLACPPHP